MTLEWLTPPDANELLAFIGGITKGGTREMVDLAKITERCDFHTDKKARVSIKKVLPVVLKTPDYLCQRYQVPIFGVSIPGLNYKGLTWWEERSGH